MIFLGKELRFYYFKIRRIRYGKSSFSIKVDTNFDNLAMLHILEKLDYQYCGEVYFREVPEKPSRKF